MSTTGERILVVVLLIAAVLFGMRDARAGMFGNGNSYAGSPTECLAAAPHSAGVSGARGARRWFLRPAQIDPERPSWTMKKRTVGW